MRNIDLKTLLHVEGHRQASTQLYYAQALCSLHTYSSVPCRDAVFACCSTKRLLRSLHSVRLLSAASLHLHIVSSSMQVQLSKVMVSEAVPHCNTALIVPCACRTTYSPWAA